MAPAPSLCIGIEGAHHALQEMPPRRRPHTAPPQHRGPPLHQHSPPRQQQPLCSPQSSKDLRLRRSSSSSTVVLRRGPIREGPSRQTEPSDEPCRRLRRPPRGRQRWELCWTHADPIQLKRSLKHGCCRLLLPDLRCQCYHMLTLLRTISPSGIPLIWLVDSTYPMKTYKTSALNIH